jgi:hypothetical protein
MTHKKIIAIIATALFSTLALAQTPPPSLTDLDRSQELQEQMSALKKLKVALEEMTARRKMACTKSFGSETFCSCLATSLPVNLS